MSKFKNVCGVIAFVHVFPNAGRGRSHRTGHSSPFPGMVRVFALMALWVLFCNLAGAFDYTEPERRKPREVRREPCRPYRSDKSSKPLSFWAREKLSLKK